MEDIIYLNMVEMERSHWWFKGRREIIGKVLTPFLKPNIRMLDAGCGAGGNMEFMGKYGTVFGIDISKEMVEYCRTVGLKVSHGSVCNIPFEDGDFDVVLCLDVLEHIADEQVVVKELKRVVKPGGILIFSVPAFTWLWGKHDVQNNHFRRYNFNQLESLLKKSGLYVERSTYFNCFLLPAVWFFRRMLPKKSLETDFEIGSGSLNQLLLSVLKLESFLLGFCNLPIGVSQVIISRKK